MSGQEFGLWLSAYNAEPWGDYRADFNAGTIAATVANMAGKALKGGASLGANDFIPKWGEEISEIDPEQFFMSQ